MELIAIKGSKERGADIIKALESLGGINVSDVKGNNEACGYLIDHFGRIESTVNPVIKMVSIEEYMEEFSKYPNEVILVK